MTTQNPGHSPPSQSNASEITEDQFLGGQLSVLQPARAYRAGLDAVLLAAAVPPALPSAGLARATPATVLRALDAGAGVGVAGLCLARRLPHVDVTLVEREPALTMLAADNIERNALAGRVHLIEADLLSPASTLEAGGLVPGTFDIALANPPFDIEGTGRAPPNPVKAGANLMAPGDLDRWARFLARMTTPRGLLVMIHRADALPRLLTALVGRFGAIEILPLHSRPNAPAHRILLRARKASSAPLTLHPGLVLHGDGNAFQPSVDAILRHGAALAWPPAEFRPLA